MLHILNGDTTRDLIKESSVKGTFLVWKDMLMEGPVPPASAKDGGVDWKARAAFLNRQYGIDGKKYLAGMAAFFKALDKAAKGKEEVVFWFEEDFFCQIHLIYLLANLPEALKRKGRASVICPEKPLGVRLSAAFPKLLEGRIPLEAPLLSLASKVWSAYAASSSQGWDTFLKWARSGKGFEPWPLLKSGLRSHLGRLPSANGKPNAMETALLRSAASGHAGSSGANANVTFGQFLRRVWSEPLVRPLGLGDLQVARYVLDLSLLPKPLIAISGSDNNPAPGETFQYADWKLHLTPEGKARLAETGSVPLPTAGSEARPTAGTEGRPAAKIGVGRKVSGKVKPALLKGAKSGAKSESKSVVKSAVKAVPAKGKAAGKTPAANTVLTKSAPAKPKKAAKA